MKDISKMLEAMQNFIDGHAHIEKAEQLEEQGNLVLAYKEFGKIFGGYYPSYVDMMAKKIGCQWHYWGGSIADNAGCNVATISRVFLSF